MGKLALICIVVAGWWGAGCDHPANPGACANQVVGSCGIRKYCDDDGQTSLCRDVPPDPEDCGRERWPGECKQAPRDGGSDLAPDGGGQDAGSADMADAGPGNSDVGSTPPQDSGTPDGSQTPPGFAEFTIPGGRGAAVGITLGPDGNLWFTDQANQKIGRMTPMGSFVEFPITAKAQTITTGPDQNLWFTMASNRIGRMNAAGAFLGDFDGGLVGTGKIVAGEDGHLWFTQCAGDRISRMNITGTLADFPVMRVDVCPFAIAAGPDGNLWFTELFGDRVGRITPSGVLDAFPLDAGVRLNYIAAGPDGNLWFAEFGKNKIGRMATDGRLLAEYTVPTANSGPAGITKGPDGHMWFTETNAHKIGRISMDGIINEYPTPTAPSAPYEIIAGPDGALWFTETEAGKIGRFKP